MLFMAKSTISMAMPKADGLPVLQVGSSGTSALTRCEQLRRDMETIVTMEKPIEKPWENYGKTIKMMKIMIKILMNLMMIAMMAPKVACPNPSLLKPSFKIFKNQQARG